MFEAACMSGDELGQSCKLRSEALKRRSQLRERRGEDIRGTRRERADSEQRFELEEQNSSGFREEFELPGAAFEQEVLSASSS